MTGFDPQALLACISTRWTPRIGDPTSMGWMTVGAYLVTGLLAGAVVWRCRAMLSQRAKVFWGATAVLMLFLAVNKQLDLQSALTATGRCLAQIQGWYDTRRQVQAEFILALVVAAGVALVLGLYSLRRDLWRNLLALLGVACVVTFVLVRAVGFHHVDGFLSSTFHGARMNWILELSGLVLISLNAVLLLVFRKRAGGRGPAPPR